MAAKRAPSGGLHPPLAYRADEGWPSYSDDEVEAATAVLRSGRVNQWTGSEVTEFQEACAERFGGGHGIAVANGTLALELALRAFGIGQRDEVIVTPRSFVASASCVRLVGAKPVFADVDADSGNLTARTIEPLITAQTRAIIPVHLAGWPCDMAPIMALAERHGLRVIEDCAQAHGAEIDGRSVGSFGHAAAFSFCQDKIISTGGEGGFASFRDKATWEWAWAFKDHGKNWRKASVAPGGSGFRWLHDDVGTNWRLTGPQAAIGLVQLRKLASWTEARTRNARLWADALADVPGLRVPLPPPRFRHAFYKLYAYVDRHGEEAGAARDQILERAADAGLRIFSGSCSEIYLEQAFADLPRPALPNAQALGRASLLMEVHPTLNPDLTRSRASALAAIAQEVLG